MGWPVNSGVPVDVTLWGLAGGAQVQVTAPPTATVSTAGLLVLFRTLTKLLLRTDTFAVAGAGGSPMVAVAVNNNGDPMAPSTVACAVLAPSAPNVHVALAIPLASVAVKAGSI